MSCEHSARGSSWNPPEYWIAHNTGWESGEDDSISHSHRPAAVTGRPSTNSCEMQIHSAPPLHSPVVSWISHNGHKKNCRLQQNGPTEQKLIKYRSGEGTAEIQLLQCATGSDADSQKWRLDAINKKWELSFILVSQIRWSV